MNWLRNRSKRTLFGITTWNGDSIELTVTPCNDTEDVTIIYVDNQRGKMVITSTAKRTRAEQLLVDLQKAAR